MGFSKVRAFVLIFAAVCAFGGGAAGAKTYKLYYLGGQSNMDGFGYVKQLPEQLRGPAEGVMIFHGNTAPDGGEVDGRGIWSILRPGHGTGFKSDGGKNKYSNRFGVELTFGRRMKEIHPDANIAIIKYSRGGTSIHADAARDFGCWEPDFKRGNGVNQYDHFRAAVANAKAVTDIDAYGEPDTLVPAGIVWMQGESDAQNPEIAKAYEENLRRLMGLIRDELGGGKIPVAVGRISDSGQDDDGKVWDYGEIVRQAQADFVLKDGRASLVSSTDGYGHSDKWHYDSEGYIDLGRRFAEAVLRAAEPMKVFVLAGQSNMVGAGIVKADPRRNEGKGTLEWLVEKRPEQYGHLVDAKGNWVERGDVMIWYMGKVGPLGPGYGGNEDRIGPELGFGDVVGDEYGRQVLLIKVAWGGKSLAVDFRPPSSGGEVGPYYKELLQHVRDVLGRYDKDEYDLAGFGWHQGWNDRINQAFNDAYEENMANFIRDIRRDLGVKDLPFVIAETGMSGHKEKHPRALSLMRAQAAVAERDEFEGNVAFVGTKDFFRPKEQSPSGQAYHWNTNAETYYLIGEGMGKAIVRLCGN